MFHGNEVQLDVCLCQSEHTDDVPRSKPQATKFLDPALEALRKSPIFLAHFPLTILSRSHLPCLETRPCLAHPDRSARSDHPSDLARHLAQDLALPALPDPAPDPEPPAPPDLAFLARPDLPNHQQPAKCLQVPWCQICSSRGLRLLLASHQAQVFIHRGRQWGPRQVG